MGLINSIKSKFKKEKAEPVNPKDNPYRERLLHTVTVDVLGEKVDIPITEIKNIKAEVMGGQAVFQFRGEKVPILISSPHADNFSIGINIAMHKANMSDFKKELARLQEEGTVSAGAKLSYNPDTRNAILFMRSDSANNGNVQRWRTICDNKMQVLINDFLALMPWIMHIYGE